MWLSELWDMSNSHEVTVGCALRSMIRLERLYCQGGRGRPPHEPKADE